MANRLSHSAINRYNMCGESYRLHYIERIRPTGTTSALLFGAALDNALNILLTKPNESAEQIFEDEFKQQDINGQSIYIPTSTQVVYSKTDYDADLITQDDVEVLENFAKESGLQGYTNHLSAIKEFRKADTLTSLQQAYVNFASWICLYHKGMLMLKAYREKILPKVIKVHEVQKQFSLSLNGSDSITGLVDLVAEIEDKGLVVLDNKTSGRPYDKTSAKGSEQLALYKHALKVEYPTELVGYIVLLKRINKNRIKICSKCDHDGSATTHLSCPNIVDGERCHGTYVSYINPEVDVQLIIDRMPKEIEDGVIATAQVVNDKITNKVFEKNLACCDKWFGNQCPYFNLCHHNKMDGLEKVVK